MRDLKPIRRLVTGVDPPLSACPPACLPVSLSPLSRPALFCSVRVGHSRCRSAQATWRVIQVQVAHVTYIECVARDSEQMVEDARDLEEHRSDNLGTARDGAVELRGN